MVAIDSCNLVFSLSTGMDLTTDSKYNSIFFGMIIEVTEEYEEWFEFNTRLLCVSFTEIDVYVVITILIKQCVY